MTRSSILESMRRASVLLAVVATAALSTAHAAADDKQQCLAASDQGQQMRDDGKYRRAREAFAACARDACPALVRRDCVKWLADLEQSSPSIVVGAKDDKGGDLVDVTVLVDGAALVTKLDGKPVQVDPGQHVFRFVRQGSEPAETTVVLRAGEKNRFVGVTLRHPVAVAEIPPPAVEREPGASFFSARNVSALSMLVLGGAAVGAGAYFLGQAGSRSGAASSLRGSMPSYACTDAPTSTPCQQLSSAVDAQHTDAGVGTAMLVGGGVLLVGALVVWAAWPRAAESKAGLQLVAPALRVGTREMSAELGWAF